MIRLAVVGIPALFIDFVLGRLVTIELWRALRYELLYENPASTGPEWAAAAMADVGLFGVLVLLPGLAIAGSIAGRIGILSD